MDSKLKPSKYNVKFFDEDGDLLIFNTLTGNKAKIKASMAEGTMKYLKDTKSYQCGEINKDLLISKKFVVESQTDEDEIASQLHRITINSEKMLTLILLPTENCNFRCKYCYESFEKNWMKESVRNAVIKFIEKNITNYESIHFEWFGGEPLTAYPVIEYISKKVMEICRKNKVRYTASMTTNGYLLDVEMFRKLQKLRVINSTFAA